MAKIPITTVAIGVGSIWVEPTDGTMYRQTTPTPTPAGFEAVAGGGGAFTGDASDVDYSGDVPGASDVATALDVVQGAVDTVESTLDDLTPDDIVALDIADATAAGRSMITAADAAAQTALLVAGSTTVSGRVEIADATETSTGTDATRVVSPDGLAGSEFGKVVIQVPVFGVTTDCATGDSKLFFLITPKLNGMNLVGIQGAVDTAGTTGTMDIQVHRRRSGSNADMLSTKLTIDSAEETSGTAAVAAVINGSNDDVATHDKIYIDIDAVHTTPAKGLVVSLTFQLP